MHIASCILFLCIYDCFSLLFVTHQIKLRPATHQLRPSALRDRSCAFPRVLWCVWSFLSVAAAVVCCCWLLKFITHIHSSSGPGSLSEYFMILRSPAFDLWILSAVETTELLLLWGMTLFTNTPCKRYKVASNRICDGLFLLRITRPGKQRGKTLH